MMERTPPIPPVARRWSLDVHSFGFPAGAAAAVGVLLVFQRIGPTYMPPEGMEGFVSFVYDFGPGLLPALAALVVRLCVPQLRRAAGAALKGALLAQVLLTMSVCTPFGMGSLVSTPPGPKTSLMLASGYNPATEPDPGPLTAWTADELNRRHRGQPDRPITYVPADAPSTGPLVVSVNPVDDYTWGAAALSPRGRCYLILALRDRTNPRYGSTRYGVLPPGAPCVGAAANAATVTGESWPPGYY